MQIDLKWNKNYRLSIKTGVSIIKILNNIYKTAIILNSVIIF
jgi:hypothetical protein